MIEPRMKYSGQIPARLCLNRRAQFIAADFLSCQICKNTAHGAMEVLFSGDIFERKQEKSAFVHFCRLLRAVVSDRRAKSWFPFGYATRAVIRGDQPCHFLLASGYASSRFGGVNGCEKRHASA